MFTLKIRTTNDAFAEDPEREVAALLRKYADRVEAGQSSGTILDTNGATVGEWKLTSR